MVHCGRLWTGPPGPTTVPRGGPSLAVTPPPQFPLLGAFEHQASNTRRMLERVPDDRFDWRPHPKSMTLGRLANHVADLVGMPAMVLSTESRDMLAGQRPPDAANGRELLDKLDRGAAAARSALASATPDQLRQTWTLRRGDQVVFSMPKRAVLMTQMLHMVHHRGQLSVYLRLNDVPVPGMFGPSADD